MGVVLQEIPALHQDGVIEQKHKRHGAKDGKPCQHNLDGSLMLIEPGLDAFQLLQFLL